MKELIKNLSNDDIIQICNEIYDWKNGEGILNQQGMLKKLWNENKDEYFSVYYLADFILMEAHERFGKLVKLLFVDKAGLYIR